MNRFTLHFSALLTVLFVLVSGLSASASESPRVDMTGRVTTQDGKPLPRSLVMIFAAGPRQGNSPLCPFTYPDCGKRAMTDAEGNFRIESLDPALEFCLCVLVANCTPFTQSKIIPEAGPVNVTLAPRDLSKIPNARQVQGLILGPDGNPVAGAFLDVNGLVKDDSTHFGGFKADGMGITDENGEYHLAGEEDFNALLVTIEAPGVAKRWAKLETGKKQLLRMKEGGTVQGRLLVHNQPLAGIKLDMATTTRTCGEYLTGFHATTDAQGRFVFHHLPPTLSFDLFGLMDSFRGRQSGLLRKLDTPSDGQSLDLGDIQATPAHRLAGHVVLSDGKPVPPGTRMLISREEAWNHQLVEIGKDGAFDATDIPEEQLSIMLHIEGYRFSEKNPCLDSNHRGLMGRITKDISNLNILLEPGKPLSYEEIDHPSYEEQKKRGAMPLHGVQ